MILQNCEEKLQSKKSVEEQKKERSLKIVSSSNKKSAFTQTYRVHQKVSP